MELGKGSTALIVVDMQNGFLAENGSCSRAGIDCSPLRVALPACEQLVAAARAANVPIIFSRYVYQKDYVDGGIVVREFFPVFRSVGALKEGTDDIEVVPSLSPLPGDLLVDKNRPSAFFGTRLDSYLKGLGVDSLVVCGITANVCVETTVRDAMQRDYKIWVPREAVAEFEETRLQGSLASMAWMFAKIMDLPQVVEAMPSLGRRR